MDLLLDAVITAISLVFLGILGLISGHRRRGVLDLISSHRRRAVLGLSQLWCGVRGVVGGYGEGGLEGTPGLGGLVVH